VKEQPSFEELAAQIKIMYSTGVSAVVIGLSAFGKQSDSDDTIKCNIELLLTMSGDIPIGIYESKTPYCRLFSPNLLKFVANLENVWFYIDSSKSANMLNEKNQILRDFTLSFRSYATSGTFLGHCLTLGMDGYCGSASSFLPKIYVWLFEHHIKNTNNQEDKNQYNALSSFLSISEPTIEYLYPFSLKIFLGIHLKNLKIEAVSRLPQPDMNQSVEENLLRIAHLNDASQFVIHNLETKARSGKPTDHSVLL